MGLLARLALTEAAGWLAHAHAWVHPLDLALRAADLTAPARPMPCSPASAGWSASRRCAPSSCRSGAPIPRSASATATRRRAALRGGRPARRPGGSVTWPAAALALIAESARLACATRRAAGRRGAGQGRFSPARSPLAAARRARCAAAGAGADAEGAGARLRIAPQTATALLRKLQGKGVVREVTGRGRFRRLALAPAPHWAMRRAPWFRCWCCPSAEV